MEHQDESYEDDECRCNHICDDCVFGADFGCIRDTPTGQMLAYLFAFARTQKPSPVTRR